MVKCDPSSPEFASSIWDVGLDRVAVLDKADGVAFLGNATGFGDFANNELTEILEVDVAGTTWVKLLATADLLGGV